MDLIKVKEGKIFLWAQLSTTPGRRISEWRYSSTHSLTSALDGGEMSASCPGHFTRRERAPVTHWIGGGVGPNVELITHRNVKKATLLLEL
jgi:hypothetical protein